MNGVTRVAITGGTGFVGGHLTERLAREDIGFHILSRQLGDLRNRADFRGCDAVVNLADSAEWSRRDVDAVAGNLAAEAIANNVGRFVHLSTAVVVGQSNAEMIDEQTECRPKSAYEIRKFRLEQQLESRLAGRVDLVILRPTAVFGAGGQNGLKIADDLRHDPSWKRSLRSALLRRRSLNLVAVGNVVEAIVFVLRRGEPFRGARFIVSDDEDPLNNYAGFAAALAQKLGIDSRPTSLPLLDRLLPLLLRLRGRSLTNPEVRFSSAKLRAIGYRPAIALGVELDRFAASLP